MKFCTMSVKNILLRTINQRNKFINLASTTAKVHLQQLGYNNEQEQQHRNYRKIVGAALFSAVLFAKSKDKKQDVEEVVEAGEKKPGLPTYRADEVCKHDNKKSCWVIYKHGVYDVTKFLPGHPGGEQIMNAAGLSIEPFWEVYGMHKTNDVFKLLETYRIGNLHDDDVGDYSESNLWVAEPQRDRRLVVKTARPFNAETPAKLLVENLDTPNELFFIRQHMSVPELEAAEHSLRITIIDGSTNSKQFNLQELMNKFPKGEVRAALMCAGNRRSEMSNAVKAVKGIGWQQGAICSAVWRGVLLRDVLVHCGVDASNTAGKHVIFTGSDIDATGTNFSTSIPLAQALNPNGQILLATHMNGEELPRDHGYPLRVIVPGAPAVRSVKWLESITVSNDESPSHWHQKDYRSFNASETWETAHFPSAPPIYSLPVTSAICDPAEGDECVPKDGFIEVRGYAYSGGGNSIVRVDVSGDGGASWVRAHSLRADAAPPALHYAWTLWTASVPVEAGQKQMELWAKATDSNFNTQPEKFEDIWNLRGLLSNAYHRVKINIKQSSSSWFFSK